MIHPRRIAVVFSLALLSGCRGGGDARAPATSGNAPASTGSDLTPFQLENGIGPVTTAVQLGPINHEMAEAGKALFTVKCSACHKMTEKYVGPPLGDVTTRLTAAFIMNQILNPEEMYTRHPAVRELLGQYMTQMPNLALTQDQARQIVEYLRTQAQGKP